MTKVSFCGISGSGMSPLAQILKLKGLEVRGSDRSFDQGKDLKSKQILEEMGIRIYPQDGSSVTDDLDMLYISTAVEDTIPDIKAAQEKQIPIKKRFDLLAELFHQYPHNIAVGGTSGKTTTTAMIGYILDQLGKQPTVINGGTLINYRDKPGIPNYIYNDGDICVIEADESNGSINQYHPYIGVINNISLDHKSIEELQQLFGDFAQRCRHGIVVNADCDECSGINHPHRKLTFSLQSDQADFYASDIQPLPDGTGYTLDGQTFTLRLIGRFNVANALAAIAACSLLGIDKFAAAKALEGFLGTNRRLEVIGSKNNITVIDDFAHNPDKVNASMGALKSYAGRLIVLFQPHGFNPMRLMGKEIIEAFVRHIDDDDILILPEIFFAGGTVTRDISSQDLVNLALEKGKNAHFFATRDETLPFILQQARPGDRIVIMGARDNTLPDFCRTILKGL